MCKFFKIPRSLVYYIKKAKKYNTELENTIISIFRKSRDNYGARKIKKKLKEGGLQVSRRKIREIMKKYNLISNYTIKQYKIHKCKCNEEKVENIVNREFQGRDDLEVIVSDLTYVNVMGKWYYICLLINLFNREIVGFSSGNQKNAKLVCEAFMRSKINLSKVKIFHTDRGNEFKNKEIDEVLRAFKVKRSLSKKGMSL